MLRKVLLLSAAMATTYAADGQIAEKRTSTSAYSMAAFDALDAHVDQLRETHSALTEQRAAAQANSEKLLIEKDEQLRLKANLLVASQSEQEKMREHTASLEEQLEGLNETLATTIDESTSLLAKLSVANSELAESREEATSFRATLERMQNTLEGNEAATVQLRQAMEQMQINNAKRLEREAADHLRLAEADALRKAQRKSGVRSKADVQAVLDADQVKAAERRATAEKGPTSAAAQVPLFKFLRALATAVEISGIDINTDISVFKKNIGNNLKLVPVAIPIDLTGLVVKDPKEYSKDVTGDAQQKADIASNGKLVWSQLRTYAGSLGIQYESLSVDELLHALKADLVKRGLNIRD